MKASRNSKSSGFPPNRDASCWPSSLPKSGIMINGNITARHRWDKNKSRCKPTIPTPTRSWGGHGIPTRNKKSQFNEYRFAKQVRGITGSPRPPVSIVEVLMGLPEGWLQP